MAILSGEVSADTLEAYRRASLAVYDALDHSESHRESAKAEGKNAWTLPPATKAEILCTWNAFVLQTLGDRFLEADYHGDPNTVGFVPPITSDQILRFYSQVEGWLNRAQQAHFNPNYVLDVAVPADLPAWSEVEPCPNAHLFGMLEAMRAVRDHTEAALTFLNDSPPQGKEQEKQRDLIRQLHASAATKARYADDMVAGNPSKEVHERVEEHVKAAIEGYYKLGQLLAMPELATQVLAPPPPVAAPANAPTITALALPGTPGFDPWCLTDPESQAKFKKDPEARKALDQLWKLDPSPAETLRIQAEINAAFARRDIRYALDRYNKKLGHFFCAPWGAVYEVLRPITLNGRRLTVGQQFIYNVTCEGVNLGAPFRREIMVGAFAPTTKFEYGDPDEEPDH
jgi:hypothetical protein